MKNKVKIPVAIIITDTHLTKDNGELVKSIYNQVIKIAKERGIEYIFHAGDVFTCRSGQPLSCLTDWKEISDKVCKAGIREHEIPGNHDKTDADDERSYLDMYVSINKTVHRKGEVVIISEDIIVAFIPYFHDEKWLDEYNNVCEIVDSMFIDKDVNKDCKKILITHSGFDGVMNNDGTSVSSIIKPSMFKDWDKVLIGHYHNASKLADNVIYIGSAYQNNYGETITDKGCHIIYDDASLEFVPLKFPKYIKEVIDVNDKDTLRNLIEKYDGESYDNIRFIFRGNKSDASKVDLSELAKLGIDAKFEAIESEEAMLLSETDTIMVCDKKSIIRDFTKFCSENKIRGKHLQYGLKLIRSL